MAKTSLSFDRNEKASIYAKAGIPELWIFNLNTRQIEVHRPPVASTASIYGFHYASLEYLSGNDL